MANIDNKYTNELVCPYCGYEHSDSWELSEDCSEIDCGDCGKSFSYSRIVNVEYTTEKIKCNEKHDYLIDHRHITYIHWDYHKSDNHNDIMTKPIEELRWLVVAKCSACNHEVYGQDDIGVTEEQFEELHKGEYKWRVKCHITEYKEELFKIRD